MSSPGPLKNDHEKSCENETNNSFDDGRTEGESVMIISSNMLSAHSSASKLNDTDESLLIRSDMIGGLPAELRVNSNINRFGEGNKEGECKKPNNLVRTF